MSEGVLQAVMSSVADEPGIQRAAFIWHGGEPTLVPGEFLRTALSLQEKYLVERGIEVTNALQTNGTHLTDQWLDLIAEKEIGVGISVDGPPEVNDETRILANGRPSSAHIAVGLAALRDRGIPFGVTVVASRALLEAGAERLWTYVQSEQFREVNVLPVRGPLGPDAETIEPESHDLMAWSTFMIELFDLWFASDRRTNLLFFDSVLRRLMQQPTRTCVLAGRCFGMVFGIEPDGRVTHCPLFTGQPSFEIGNVLTTSFGELRRSELFRRVVEENERRLDAVKQCAQFGICLGGCPRFSLADSLGTSPFDLQASCCGYRPVLDHITSRVGATPVRVAVP